MEHEEAETITWHVRDKVSGSKRAIWSMSKINQYAIKSETRLHCTDLPMPVDSVMACNPPHKQEPMPTLKAQLQNQCIHFEIIPGDLISVILKTFHCVNGVILLIFTLEFHVIIYELGLPHY